MGGIGDDRGQSVQVGAVLLFGILIVFLAIWQAQVVPAENADVEFQHSLDAQEDMQQLRSEIRSVAGSGATRSTTIELGTRYPTRVAFVNPPPATGSLSTTGGTVSIENVSADSTNGFWNGTTRNYTTNTIAYKPSYSEYTNPPRTMYEHGLLYNEFDREETQLAESSQRLVTTSGDTTTIDLVALGGSIDENGVERESIDLYPNSASTRTVSVTANATTEPITITIPTRNQAIWNETLAEVEGTAIESVTNVSDSQVRIELNSTGDMSYRLRLAEVGLEEENNQQPAYIVPVGPQDVSTGEDITAEVRDRYNNPVADAAVDAGSLGTLSTDRQGRVTVTADAPGSIDLSIINPASDCSECHSVSYTVTEPTEGGSGGRLVSNGSIARPVAGPMSTLGTVSIRVRNDVNETISLQDILITTPHADNIKNDTILFENIAASATRRSPDTQTLRDGPLFYRIFGDVSMGPTDASEFSAQNFTTQNTTENMTGDQVSVSVNYNRSGAVITDTFVVAPEPIRAVIDAPDTVNDGDDIDLNGMASLGNSFEWTATDGDGNEIAVSDSTDEQALIQAEETEPGTTITVTLTVERNGWTETDQAQIDIQSDTDAATISGITLENDGSDNLEFSFDSSTQLESGSSAIGVSADGPQTADVYQFNRGDFSETDNGDGTFSYTLTTTQPYDDGAGTYTATVDDAVGIDGTNYGNNGVGSSLEDSYTLESVAPEISDVLLESDGDQNISFSFRSSEALDSGSSGIGVSIDSPTTTDAYQFNRGDFSETDNGDGTFTYTLSTTQLYDDGEGNYTATVDDAIDPDGNNGGENGEGSGLSDSYTLSYNYNISILSTTPAGSNEIDIEFNADTNDPDAEVEIQSIKQDGSVQANTTVPVDENQPQTERIKGENQADEVQVILYDGNGQEQASDTQPYP